MAKVDENIQSTFRAETCRGLGALKLVKIVYSKLHIIVKHIVEVISNY